MAADPHEVSTHCLLCDCKQETSTTNSTPTFDTFDNNDNKIISTEAIVKTEVVESTEKVDEQGKQSNCITGNDDNLESPKIETQVEAVFAVQKNGAKKLKLEIGESLEEFVIRDGDEYTCLICRGYNRKSRGAKGTIAHLKEEHGLYLYICGLCGNYFKKETDLSQHLESHIAKNTASDCKVCIQIFTRLKLFCSNRDFHYQPLEVFWPCTNCNEDCKSKKSLQKHIRRRHKNEPYICKACGTNKDFLIKNTYEAYKTDERSNKIKLLEPKRLFNKSCEKFYEETFQDYNDHYYCEKSNSLELNSKVKRNKAKKTKKLNKRESLSESRDFQFIVKDGDSYTCLLCKGDNSESRDSNGIIAHLEEKHKLHLLKEFKKKYKKSISESPDIQFARRDGNSYTCILCKDDSTKSRDCKGFFAHLEEEHKFHFLEEIKKESKTVSISETPDIQFAMRDGNNYTCLICKGNSKKSRDAEGTIAHIEDEHNFDLVNCEICGNYFRKRTDLVSLRRYDLTTSDVDFHCEECVRTCNRLQLFRIHKHFHYMNSDIWPCFTCDSQFFSKYVFKTHKNTCDTRDENFMTNLSQSKMHYNT